MLRTQRAAPAGERRKKDSIGLFVTPAAVELSRISHRAAYAWRRLPPSISADLIVKSTPQVLSRLFAHSGGDDRSPPRAETICSFDRMQLLR